MELIIGKEYSTLKYGNFIINKKIHEKRSGHSMYEIYFTDYPFKKNVQRSSIISGKIYNPYFPSVFGIGCMGKEYNAKHFLYGRWASMISRCYNRKDKAYKNYGKIGIITSKSWLCFENYVKDVAELDGYDEKEIIENRLNLDKDSIHFNAKIYSKETCRWVTFKENRKIVIPKYKKVIQYDLSGNFIKEWNSISEASKMLNIASSDIVNCCKLKRFSAKEFTFRYEDKNNKQKLSLVHPVNKKIAQLNKNFKYIKSFDSIVSASKNLNIPSQNISSCCKKIRKTAGGYIFMYYDDFISLTFK